MVTIFTVPMNRPFDQKEMFHYFLGMVESVDSEGVLITQVTTGLRSYFLFNSIVGIVEEEVEVEEPEIPEAPKIFNAEEAKCIDPSALSDIIEKIKAENN